MFASDFSRWVETAKNLCEIVAIFGGAAWTYLNYFRGRIYKPRLECSVEASVERRSGHSFLRVVVRIRNIGLSKVSIQQKGTGLLIDSAVMQGQAPLFPAEVRWKNLAAFEVFSGNKWGGTIRAHIRVGNDCPASRRCSRAQGSLDGSFRRVLVDSSDHRSRYLDGKSRGQVWQLKPAT